MNIRDLVPWNWGGRTIDVNRGLMRPVSSFEAEMDRMFDDVRRNVGMMPYGGIEPQAFWPNIDVSETDKQVRITAELPGMNEKDIELMVSSSGDVLTIKGEKKHEAKEERKGFYRSERYYGSFQRSVALPSEVDSSRAEATFKNGVLEVELPKRSESETGVKKISVRAGA